MPSRRSKVVSAPQNIHMVNAPGHPSQSPNILTEEIIRALQTVGGYGSVEIFVQNNIVTQITVRNIKKTSVAVSRKKIEPTLEEEKEIPINVQYTS